MPNLCKSFFVYSNPLARRKQKSRVLVSLKSFVILERKDSISLILCSSSAFLEGGSL